MGEGGFHVYDYFALFELRSSKFSVMLFYIDTIVI